MSPPRVLYISGSIGLGHVSKDLAIAGELRRARPGTEILWLAGHPASQVLRDAGEHVLPEADRWIGASEIAERATRNGELNLVRYVYHSLPSWGRNTRLVASALASCRADIAVGNEAWEVDVPLVAHVLRLPVPFVMIFDFVGVVPTTPSLLDRIGAWGLNALWAFDGSVYGNGPHSAVFIGEPEDVQHEPLGLGLPDRRRHAVRYYEFVGHAIGFAPEDYADGEAWRRALGYGDEPLVVCSAGGTAIGRDLLELCGQAYAPLRERLPGARMVLVCGPRLPVESIRAPDGVELRGHVPRLYEHFACCDVAVGQCGASSTTELSALGRPFIYFPIDGHYEQELVAARLRRHGLGRRMSLRETSPAMLADAIVEERARTVTVRALPVEGAAKAAAHILRTLERCEGAAAARRAAWACGRAGVRPRRRRSRTAGGSTLPGRST
jgi:predicted glycosyltransferase